nr:immunoglobulin light chain junction region [Macaca mulatta]MOW44824.1 immunoglobulin light chain junction region [Macaca mulatta]
CQHHYSYPHSF